MNWSAAGLAAATASILLSGWISGSGDYYVLGGALAISILAVLLSAHPVAPATATLAFAVGIFPAGRTVQSRLGGELGADFGALVLVLLTMLGATAASAHWWRSRTTAVVEPPAWLAWSFVPGALGGLWWIVADVANQYSSFLVADALAGGGFATAAFFLVARRRPPRQAEAWPNGRPRAGTTRKAKYRHT